ncbi:patatin-like phospholipase family protein [Fictibacillus enclensis]|uniref:patatin-like phospholipase family protein n=1 Tax=Fictibacillus enclensis TaxID=1017270 RepID=UPI0025A1E463|nr:patatin-like phospholipase family protein [Fictibacillus enclensis]MDM5337957.1 patatin-like phospholipase family protein [Fictibacillus enclensis]
MHRPIVGLALGSGGARGFAHIGVIKALREAGIPIDMIAGSSMGALVGAMVGMGHNNENLIKMATLFKRKYYMDYTVPKMGFVSGKKIKELIRLLTQNKRIEDTIIPISIVATDLIKGEKIVFRNGPIAEAVRASISIPGIFVPEKIGGRLLVDGGVIERVPAAVVREMGADIVVAVDISHFKAQPEMASILDVIVQSIDIMQREIVRYHEISADIMVRPMVEQFSSTAFKNVNEIISIGEEAGKSKIESIKHKIETWKENNHERYTESPEDGMGQ